MAQQARAASRAGVPVAEAVPAPPWASRPAYRVQLAVKRMMDIAGAGAGLVVLSPLFIGIAVAIKRSSPGPVFYPWRVVGNGGRYFTSWKFRTMVTNADALKDRLRAHNEMTGPMFKMANDPRITPLGRALRKYSLDELPQLWSVLKGDMSLVGPRPPLQREWEQFEPWQRGKLAVTPGLTCLWQVRGRNDITNFDDWVRLDLEYIDTWSLWLDIKILLQTVPAVLRGTGK